MGRDRLIEVAQRLLESSSAKLIGRNDVAEAANVTPALVNYYFPDQASLIEAATAPVISRSLADLRRILHSSAQPEDKLRQLIELFLSFNRDHAAHLDDFLSICARDKSKELYRTTVLDAYQDLVGFFSSELQHRNWHPAHAAFLVFALFGTCKFVAQSPLLPVSMFDAAIDKAEMLALQTTLVFNLMTQGIADRDHPGSARDPLGKPGDTLQM